VNPAGIITTVAGTGTCCYAGDGGPAIGAEIGAPYGLAVDASGSVYIADTNNQRIRKVTAAGIISTVAGNGTAGYSGDGGQATSASIPNPGGVAVDPSGNLYITDGGNRRVRKVNAAGTISTAAGGPRAMARTLWAASLLSPIGVAKDASGTCTSRIRAPIASA